MDIEEMTVAELKAETARREAIEAAALTGGGSAFPFAAGTSIMIRTVTMFLLGRLVSVGNQELALSDASWIADTRKWSEFLAKGIAEEAEIEPYPDGIVAVGRGAIVDVCAWLHDLPRSAQ